MKLIKKLISFIVISLTLFGAVIIFSGYNMYKEAIDEIDLDAKIKELRNNDDYVLFNDLPEDYVTAVIDVEDHKFYDHKGINIISIGRAVINNIKAGKVVEGGSTITQQVAKNVYFTQEKSVIRKIAELFVVYNLESNYTKEDIFELYVNTSYFGSGYYGVGQASKGYFDKPPKAMSLYESTLLAGIPNAPSIYAPTKNPDLAAQRQKQVIRKMLNQGHLTNEEAEKLYEEIE